jgi:outer membrane protein assembly factor BamD
MSDFRKFSLLLAVALLAACANIPLETKPDAIYREGEDLYASKRFDDAIAQYKRVREAYASTELSTNAELRIADAYYDSERYIEAAAAYSEFRKLHPVHAQAAYALYRMGLCSYHQITGTDRDQTPQKNAVVYFEELLVKYPKSEHAADVKDKLEAVKLQQLEYEQYVARQYYRAEKYNAAIKRLEDALTAFPKSPLHDETWYLLGASQLRSGNPEKGRDAFNKLSTNFPDSKFIKEAGKLLEKHY